MKKVIALFLGVFLAVSSYAQAPDAFNYQAVARDVAGTPIANANINVTVSILPGSEVSAPIYSESFSILTNDFGLLNLQVGNGSVILGDITTIDWVNGPYFLKVEFDLDEGSGSLLVGVSQLLSVPYALHARSADNVFSGAYNDLSGLPDWNDSIALYTHEANAAENDLLVHDGSNWVAKHIVMGNTGSGQAVSIMPPFQVVNFCIALFGVYPSRNVVEPFIGTISAFGFSFAPRGWAKCDGQLLTISDNASLWTLLGTTFGGDGRSTFGLPDLRGRMPMHQGQGPGLTNRWMGTKKGAEALTITIGALPAHKHVISYE